MSREHALKLLWDGFKCQLIDSWPLYASFGSDLDEAKEQIKFCEAVIHQMEAKFIANDIEFDVLNHLTLYNYFKTDGFSVHAKTKTLNSFSAFIGYENWKYFKNGVDNNEISKETFAPCTYKTAAKDFQKRKQPLVLPGWVLITLAVLIILVVAFFLRKKALFVQHQKELISQAVIGANEAEFQAYRNIPQIDSTQLKKHFSEDGTAYNSVLGLLLRSKRKKRSLLIPPSSYVLENIEVAEIGKQQAVVRTTEHWIIRWLDSISQREILYDTVNHHTYYLQNIDGQWKVHVDVYTGKARIPASEVVD